MPDEYERNVPDGPDSHLRLRLRRTRERTLVLLSTGTTCTPKFKFSAIGCGRGELSFRWWGCRTGNAYVDMATTPGMPMIALMNRLGATTWRRWASHGFDHRRGVSGPHDRQHGVQCDCANVTSDTCTFRSCRLCRSGQGRHHIGFVGVVTNFTHEARGILGNASSCEGLEFSPRSADTLAMMKYAAGIASEDPSAGARRVRTWGDTTETMGCSERRPGSTW